MTKKVEKIIQGDSLEVLKGFEARVGVEHIKATGTEVVKND